MKKIAYILGAVILATGTMSAAAAFADANSTAASIVSTAQSAEDAARKNTQDDATIISTISDSITSLIISDLSSGVSPEEINAAMVRAMNNPNLTKDQAAALGVVNNSLAQLEKDHQPGSAGGGGGGGVPVPANPSVPAPGYIGQ
jgi:hypothetical protein